MNTLNQIISYAIYVQGAAAWAFIAEYQRRTRGAWRRTILGWHVMALTFVDAIFSTEVALAHIWPWLALVPAFRVSLAAVFIAGALITMWRLGILVHAQPGTDSPGHPSPPNTSSSPSVDDHPPRSPSIPAAE